MILLGLAATITSVTRCTSSFEWKTLSSSNTLGSDTPNMLQALLSSYIRFLGLHVRQRTFDSLACNAKVPPQQNVSSSGWETTVRIPSIGFKRLEKPRNKRGSP